MSQSRHERALQAAPARPERRYIAVDDEVMRVLAGRRGAALLYGALATAWYEFASPEKARERERKGLGRPGDFIPLTYRTLQERTANACIASIAQWIRELAERAWPCPWGCDKQHPLVVVKRQGLRAPNLYRRWRCDEDTVVALRRPIRRPRKAMNAIQPSLSAADTPEPGPSDSAASILETRIQRPPGLHSDNQNPGTPETRMLVVDETESRDSSNQNHQYSGEPPLENMSETAAEDVYAAAIEETDEVGAVACEVVDAILSLAQRVEPGYPDDRAWSVARRLAAAVLETVNGEAAAARATLLRAITDHRLARASNPVGLLIRGIVGDDKGADRYLLAGGPAVVRNGRSAEHSGTLQAPNYATSTGLPPGLHDGLLDALRAGRTLSETWLREREISPRAFAVARAEVEAEAKAAPTSTPLSEKLAAEDPVAYKTRLERILSELELPAILRVERKIDHPMLLGMCLVRLEAELRSEADHNG